MKGAVARAGKSRRDLVPEAASERHIVPKDRVDYQLAFLAMPVLLVLDLACLVGLLFAPLPGVATPRRTFAVAVAVLLAPMLQ